MTTALICWLYCLFNYWTWSASQYDRVVYLRRAAVSAAVIPYLWVAGDVEASFVGFVAEALLLCEVVCFAYAFESFDPRIYGDKS